MKQAKPTKLVDWRAQRAGAGITIQGRDVSGKTMKVVGVKAIARTSAAHCAIAIDKTGQLYELR